MPIPATSRRRDVPSRATIVVVPRERFSFARESLESIYEHTPPPVRLVYVDGGSRPSVARDLRAAAAARGFELLRTDEYLTPNRARNLGAARAETPYVVFVDNDVLVTAGWLDALVACADATGAAIVGPLCLEGALADEKIHIAGGTLSFVEEHGTRVLRERHRHAGRRLSSLAGTLEREACDVVEFHTMLVRRDVLLRVGPLDERLTTREHVDLCLAVRDAGESIWFEPAAVMTYMAPPPFAWSDVLYYRRRWKRRVALASLHRFAAKWGVAVERRHRVFLARHRRRLVASLLPPSLRPWLRVR